MVVEFVVYGSDLILVWFYFYLPLCFVVFTVIFLKLSLFFFVRKSGGHVSAFWAVTFCRTMVILIWRHLVGRMIGSISSIFSCLHACWVSISRLGTGASRLQTT